MATRPSALGGGLFSGTQAILQATQTKEEQDRLRGQLDLQVRVADQNIQMQNLDTLMKFDQANPDLGLTFGAAMAVSPFLGEALVSAGVDPASVTNVRLNEISLDRMLDRDLQGRIQEAKDAGDTELADRLSNYARGNGLLTFDEQALIDQGKVLSAEQTARISEVYASLSPDELAQVAVPGIGIPDFGAIAGERFTHVKGIEQQRLIISLLAEESRALATVAGDRSQLEITARELSGRRSDLLQDLATRNGETAGEVPDPGLVYQATRAQLLGSSESLKELIRANTHLGPTGLQFLLDSYVGAFAQRGATPAEEADEIAAFLKEISEMPTGTQKDLVNLREIGSTLGARLGYSTVRRNQFRINVPDEEGNAVPISTATGGQLGAVFPGDVTRPARGTGRAAEDVGLIEPPPAVPTFNDLSTEEKDTVIQNAEQRFGVDNLLEGIRNDPDLGESADEIIEYMRTRDTITTPDEQTRRLIELALAQTENTPTPTTEQIPGSTPARPSEASARNDRVSSSVRAIPSTLSRPDKVGELNRIAVSAVSSVAPITGTVLDGQLSPRGTLEDLDTDAAWREVLTRLGSPGSASSRRGIAARYRTTMVRLRNRLSRKVDNPEDAIAEITKARDELAQIESDLIALREGS